MLLPPRIRAGWQCRHHSCAVQVKKNLSIRNTTQIHLNQAIPGKIDDQLPMYSDKVSDTSFLQRVERFAVACWHGHAFTGDAAVSLFPLTLLMWAPFYAIFSLMKNPANSVAEILSIVPFTSQYVMPLRMAIIDVPVWQPLLALAINAVILYGAMICGGKIYKISILSTGQPPILKQFVQWLRYA